MFNCNLLSILIIESICLLPALEDFLLDAKDVLAYKESTGSL